jgi:hypothetical protein
MKPLRSDGINSDQQEVSIIDPDDVVGYRGNPQDPEHYDVGMGADAHEEGDNLSPAPYELEPRGDDILPDQIQRFANVPADDDRELTAQPRRAHHPLSPDDLPEG